LTVRIEADIPRRGRERLQRFNRYRVLCNDLTFVQITADGCVLYDSRVDVPCDMER
jgi:hypothetical protein